MKNFIGDKEPKHIGSRRGIETQNVIMLMPQKGNNKTQSWEFGMNKTGGVRRRKVLPRLPLLILKTSTPRPTSLGLKMLLLPFPLECRMK